MSKYTTQLRFPIEQALDNCGYNHKESNWKYCYEMLGLNDYPLFDEVYRETLNNKIIRAYYFREIGFETLGLFAWQMRRTMFEIMPYYNQLYDSEKLEIEPFLTRNMDYTEKWTRDETRTAKQDNTSEATHKTDASGTTANSVDGSTTSNDRNVFNDTPMNGLDTGAVENMDYATNVTFDKGSTTSHTGANGSSTNKEERADKATEGMERSESGDYDGTKTHNEKGFDGSQSDLLLTYRKTFLNIDLEVVERVGILFMGLW